VTKCSRPPIPPHPDSSDISCSFGGSSRPAVYAQKLPAHDAQSEDNPVLGQLHAARVHGVGARVRSILWRRLQRATRRVIFVARNILSGGRHAVNLQRQVWSAVASSDIAAVQRAYEEGLSVSFPLCRLGPHTRAQDGLSRKTPLHLAAARGDSRMVRALIQMGACVHEVDQRGRSALHAAVRRGHLGAVGVLLKLGARVNQQADGVNSSLETPLHLAVCRPFLTSTRLLLQYGAQVNIATSLGETPLHIAATAGQMCMVEVLLLAGADIRARAANGWLPGTCAQKGRHNRIYSYLCKVASGRISVARMRRAEAAVALQRAHRRAKRKSRAMLDEPAGRASLVGGGLSEGSE